MTCSSGDGEFEPANALDAGDDADLELAQPGAIEELAALDGARSRVEPPGVGDDPQRLLLVKDGNQPVQRIGKVGDEARRRVFGPLVAQDRQGQLGELHVGLSRTEVGARLRELVVDFGRFDFRQKLTRFHVRADIAVPLLQVSAGTGINRRVDEGLDIARKDDFVLHGTAFRELDPDGRNGLLERFLFNDSCGAGPGTNSAHHHRPDQHQCDD